ncbi:hypothetical protein ACJX0J_025418, partial [Zea mays]
ASVTYYFGIVRPISYLQQASEHEEGTIALVGNLPPVGRMMSLEPDPSLNVEHWSMRRAPSASVGNLPPMG